MKHRKQCVVLFLLGCAALMPLQGGAKPKGQAEQKGFDLSRLSALDDAKTPAAVRVRQGVAWLRGELVSPSPSVQSLGLIDTGHVQSQIARAIAGPGCEALDTLRHERDGAASPRLRDLLTIAYAEAGVQSTIPDLCRIARHDPEPIVRREALTALDYFTLPPRPGGFPKRLHPEQQWRPLTVDERQAVLKVCLASLHDPYLVPKAESNVDYYPVREQAQQNLRNIGYQGQGR